MSAPNKNVIGTGTLSSFEYFKNLPEEEQIAQLIKLFALDPVMHTPKVISVTGDTKTDFYGKQDPHNVIFDSSYPEPIGGRRSDRSSRRYWTVDILRWCIRQAKSGRR